MKNKKVVKGSRGQMNISFGLIFAIIAGAFILFLAIFAAVRFLGVERTALEGETTKTLSILTNPLESSFESSKTIVINSPTETKIYTGCSFNERTYRDEEHYGIPIITPVDFEENPGEMLLVDEIFTFSESSDSRNGFKFWGQPHISQLSQPSNWKTPYDYENGVVYLRYELISRDPGPPFSLQFGIWQDGSEGNCERERMSDWVTLSEQGEVVFDSETPKTWWEASTSDDHPGVTVPVDFSDVGSFCRLGVPLWSNSCPPLLVSNINAENDWNRRSEYFPLTVRVTAVAVPAGGDFSGWSKWVIPTDNSNVASGSDNNQGVFGKQLLNTSQKTYGKWTDSSIGNLEFSNKFIFSENPSQGKKFYVFSKQFEQPYKVADLIYVLSSKSKYCFMDADTIRGGDLEEEIENLKQPNLLVDDCPENSINICFHPLAGCDININYGTQSSPGFVLKGNERLYFTDDALMFAAIFSDKDTYECQMKRLMKRAEVLSEIYSQKYDLMINTLGCDSGTKPDLIYYNVFVTSYEESSQLGGIKQASEILEITNERGDCRLW
jgi:hypothetical protein